MNVAAYVASSTGWTLPPEMRNRGGGRESPQSVSCRLGKFGGGKAHPARGQHPSYARRVILASPLRRMEAEKEGFEPSR